MSELKYKEPQQLQLLTPYHSKIINVPNGIWKWKYKDITLYLATIEHLNMFIFWTKKDRNDFIVLKTDDSTIQFKQTKNKTKVNDAIQHAIKKKQIKSLFSSVLKFPLNNNRIEAARYLLQYSSEICYVQPDKLLFTLSLPTNNDSSTTMANIVFQRVFF